jgi:uncharacterized protein YecE (DUF72 family)
MRPRREADQSVVTGHGLRFLAIQTENVIIRCRETMVAEILIGTSGWHYDSWRGAFFPKGLPLKQQLKYYASRFQTTELNSVFYRTPTDLAVKSWRQQTDSSFLFAWKASRFITHWKRLGESCDTSLALLESRLKLLEQQGGPVLFQLPPNFQADRKRLHAFLKLLPKRRRYSFEFRHSSWYVPQIFRLLEQFNVALCISDHRDAPSPWRRTADFIYIRGHGPTGRYKGHYSPALFAAWRKRIVSWKKQGYDVYVYFDNDQKSAAPADAARLQGLVGQ